MKKKFVFAGALAASMFVLAACGEAEPVVGEVAGVAQVDTSKVVGDDAAFIASINEYASGFDMSVTSSGLDPQEYIDFAKEACVRAEGGESWDFLLGEYFAHKSASYLNAGVDANYDHYAIGILMGKAVEDSAQFYCPAQSAALTAASDSIYGDLPDFEFDEPELPDFDDDLFDIEEDAA